MVVGYVFTKCDINKVEMENEIILLQANANGEGMDPLLF